MLNVKNESTVLSDAKLSDLFFNHEHPEYDRMFTNDDLPSRAETEEALRKDADEFAENFPEFGKSGEWYTEDFFRRL